MHTFKRALAAWNVTIIGADLLGSYPIQVENLDWAVVGVINVDIRDWKRHWCTETTKLNLNAYCKRMICALDVLTRNSVISCRRQILVIANIPPARVAQTSMIYNSAVTFGTTPLCPQTRRSNCRNSAVQSRPPREFSKMTLIEQLKTFRAAIKTCILISMICSSGHVSSDKDHDLHM